MSTSLLEGRPEIQTAAETPQRPSTTAAGSSIRWFEELTVQDTENAGGKGANLGELSRAGVPVPPGFVATAAAFQSFLDAAGLRRTIIDSLATLNVDDNERLRQQAEELQQQVRRAPIPDDLREEVVAAYRKLAQRVGEPEPFVAVRSSATVEDMPGTSACGPSAGTW